MFFQPINWNNSRKKLLLSNNGGGFPFWKDCAIASDWKNKKIMPSLYVFARAKTMSGKKALRMHEHRLVGKTATYMMGTLVEKQQSFIRFYMLPNSF